MRHFQVLLFVAASCNVAAAQTNDRYALIIGVRDYVHVSPLRNSLNDAQDMAVLLKTKRFQTVELYNPRTKAEIQDAVRSYYSLIASQKGATGLIYYSGHSMQVDGVNYLMPTTSNPQLKADLEDQALRMDYILSAVEQAGNNLNILIMDACRNNPFRSFTRSAEQGLGQINAPKGSYVVYATAPGSVASDGSGRNGLFTSKLLKHIDAPGLALEQVLKFVARDVQQESQGAQVPWINFSYFGDFYFNEATNSSASQQVGSAPPVVQPYVEEKPRETNTASNSVFEPAAASGIWTNTFKSAGDSEIGIPCSGSEYQSDTKYFRINAIGEAVTSIESKTQALSKARASMAEGLLFTFDRISTTYMKSKKSTLSNERQNLADVNTDIANNYAPKEYRIICEKLTKTQSGSFRTYITIELKVQSVLKTLDEQIGRHPGLKSGYDFDKLQSAFNSELKKVLADK